MGQHGLGGWKVVSEVERVDEVTAPVRELASAGFPECSPATRRDIVTVGNFILQRASPEVPVEVSGDGLRWGVLAPRVGEVGALLDTSGPYPRFDGAAQLIFSEDFDGLHAAFDAGALITHLCDERGFGG